MLAREHTDAAYVSYARQERLTVDGTHRLLTYSPFPVNTRGFLYLNKHPKIPMASSLRFRLTQNPDPRSFAQGIDLQTEYGTPWQIPLLALATQPRFDVLRQILRRDRFVTDQLLARCQDLVATGKQRYYGVGPWSQLIFETRQPFYLDLSAPRSAIACVGIEDIIPVHLHKSLPSPYPFECACSSIGSWSMY